MKHLKVDSNNYAHFEYTSFLDRNENPIPKPKKLTYDVGDVVYIKEENAIGVVLGVIIEETQELRTDMSGMQHYSQIEPATKKHFEIQGVKFVPKLKDELFGV